MPEAVPKDSIVSDGRVEIEETFDMEHAIKRWEERGYVILGRSNVKTAWVPRSVLYGMAKDKGATVVLVHASYSHMDNQKKTMETARVHGAYYDTATMTTINVQTARYDQNAVFLALRVVSTGHVYTDGALGARSLRKRSGRC